MGGFTVVFGQKPWAVVCVPVMKGPMLGTVMARSGPQKGSKVPLAAGLLLFRLQLGAGWLLR